MGLKTGCQAVMKPISKPSVLWEVCPWPESKPKAAPTSNLNLSEAAPITARAEPCQQTDNEGTLIGENEHSALAHGGHKKDCFSKAK